MCMCIGHSFDVYPVTKGEEFKGTLFNVFFERILFLAISGKQKSNGGRGGQTSCNLRPYSRYFYREFARKRFFPRNETLLN